MSLDIHPSSFPPIGARNLHTLILSTCKSLIFREIVMHLSAWGYGGMGVWAWGNINPAVILRESIFMDDRRIPIRSGIIFLDKHLKKAKAGNK
jgi:hypothetical protein